METLFAFLFIFARWLIPPVFLLINLKNITNYKNYLKIAGENIVLKRIKKLSNVFTVFYVIFAILGFIGLIIAKDWIYIIVVIFFLYLVTTNISINLYSNINGIYKNAIIVNEYITWDKIHSYRWINNETISFLLKNGNRIDFDKIIEKEKIIEVLIENKITENNN